MRIAIITGKRFIRTAIEIISSLRFKPYIHIFSMDEEIRAIAEKISAKFTKIGSIDDIYVHEELENFDMAIIAMDEDYDGINVARALKTMGIPTIMLILNESINRDIPEREGIKYIVGIDNYVLGNIASFIALDTWIFMNVLNYLNLGIAIHRVARRGTIGVFLKELREVARERNIGLIVLNKIGKIVEDENYEIEQGDTIIVIGVGDELYRGVNDIERVFRKHEEILARRYSETFRISTRPIG